MKLQRIFELKGFSEGRGEEEEDEEVEVESLGSLRKEASGINLEFWGVRFFLRAVVKELGFGFD